MTTPSTLNLQDVLACPVDGSPLHQEGQEWVSAVGRRYPTVEGVPVLFHPDEADTLDAMTGSRSLATSGGRNAEDPYYIETLGLDPPQKEALRIASQSPEAQSIDPVVNQIIAATCGNLYLGLVGKLTRYPIPNFRLKNGRGRILVDLGCNWGRWCMAAAREGFIPIGVDPQIGAVLAAKRVAKQLGIEAHFICADARRLPLRAGVADVVFSYSVIQHLSRADVAKVIDTSKRVLKSGGEMFVQMPNVMGPRCFYQWARRGCTDGDGFNVRYWTLGQLRRAFGVVGPVNFEVDCFFGIGLQPSDADIMPPKWEALLSASEALRKASNAIPPLTWFADSVYVKSRKD